jgi:hypothetical protein
VGLKVPQDAPGMTALQIARFQGYKAVVAAL